MTARVAPAVAMVLALIACGGGSPSGPAPVPMPDPGHTVVAIVFYDEDCDGRVQPGEPVRIPDVEVVVAGRSARTEKATGRATVMGVPAGTHAVTLRAETLPPFFTAGAPVSVQAPQDPGAPALVPVRLPIGSNRPNLYMAFGDSITRQEGAPADASYPRKLQGLLAAHFGGAEVTNQGRDGTNSFEGMDRITRNLQAQRPAYTLVMYGTNDWHDPFCQDHPPCQTVDNLRTMVLAVKREQSLPFVATLPPVNPSLNPASRNEWIKVVNDGIRAMAREQGALLVDVHAAYSRATDLPSLFADHVHPSDAGQQVIAEAYFAAIAHGRSAPSSASLSVLASEHR